MKCPDCQSSQSRKYGFKNQKPRYQCKECGRIFQFNYSSRGYYNIFLQICKKMYLNGLGFRAIERITGIHHTTIINWVRESGFILPLDLEEDWPILAELDELQTYIGKRKNKVGVQTPIAHYFPGILAIQIGDRSGQTFDSLSKRIKTWNSRRYLTDGYFDISYG